MIERLTDAEKRSLEKRLRQRLLEDCVEAKSVGYHPTDFMRMLTERGPIGACVQVIMSEKIPSGFARLAVLERLDLTAEATAVGGPWRVLFDREVIDAANERLKRFNRQDLMRP